LEGTLIGDIKDKNSIDYNKIGGFMGRLTLWMADFNHIGLIGRE
jgi:hypothetical protein